MAVRKLVPANPIAVTIYLTHSAESEGGNDFALFKVLGRIPASKVTFAQLRIFSDFPSTFAEPKIYLYLTDSKNFGCFEKL